MKEIRRFIYIPKKNRGADTFDKCIFMSPFKDDNTYKLTIGVQTINNRNFEGENIVTHEIVGDGNGKLAITISGIVNGDITGYTAEILMFDIFVEIVIKTDSHWLKTHFPDWDYHSAFKLRKEKRTYENSEIITLMDVKKSRYLSKDKDV